MAKSPEEKRREAKEREKKARALRQDKVRMKNWRASKPVFEKVVAKDVPGPGEDFTLTELMLASLAAGSPGAAVKRHPLAEVFQRLEVPPGEEYVHIPATRVNTEEASDAG